MGWKTENETLFEERSHAYFRVERKGKDGEYGGHFESFPAAQEAMEALGLISLTTRFGGPCILERSFYATNPHLKPEFPVGKKRYRKPGTEGSGNSTVITFRIAYP